MRINYQQALTGTSTSFLCCVSIARSLSLSRVPFFPAPIYFQAPVTQAIMAEKY